MLSATQLVRGRTEPWVSCLSAHPASLPTPHTPNTTCPYHYSNSMARHAQRCTLNFNCGAKLGSAKPFQPASIAFSPNHGAQGICTNLFQEGSLSDNLLPETSRPRNTICLNPHVVYHDSQHHYSFSAKNHRIIQVYGDGRQLLGDTHSSLTQLACPPARKAQAV